MQDARAKTPGASGAPTCPACGKPLDPLRAGEVSILDGRFVYFCDRQCKASHYEVSVSSRVTADAMTAEPPPVRAAVASEPPEIEALPVSDVRAKRRTRSNAAEEDDARASDGRDDEAEAAATAPPATLRSIAVRVPSAKPQLADVSPADAADDSRTDDAERDDVVHLSCPHASHADVDDADDDDEPTRESDPPEAETESLAADGDSRVAPEEHNDEPTRDLAPPGEDLATDETESPGALPRRAPASDDLQAPARASATAAPPRLPVRDLIVHVGIAAGILAGAVALLGAAAEPVRLPLAVVAAAIFFLRAPRALQDRALPPVGQVLVILGVALATAVAARWTGAPHAGALASYAGLAAAASLVSLLLVERALTPFAVLRANVTKALDVPVRVVARGGDEIEMVEAHAVKPGEEVVVQAGEVIGVDAVVTAGDATVAPWLGATHEVVRKEGESVVAGARVVRGQLRLMTTWAADERAWMRVSTSLSHRLDVSAPLAHGARTVLARGSLAVAALLGAAFLVTDAPWLDAVAAVSAAALALGSFGVVAAVATHHARAQMEALAHGVAFKDPAAFHAAGATDVAVLCARGTVLLGEPEIVALEPLAALDEARVLSLAAGAETVSTHPFASAVMRAARARGLAMENVRNVNEHAGLGVTALSASGERLVVGSRALLLQERVSVALADARISELEAQGRSVLLVSLADKLVGLVALQDGLRAGARAAVQRLHDARIEPVLLSGEARETCETIGRALDIEHIRPEVLPPDRGAEVRALGEGGHVVAVLGQPQTDDAALGAADVSVALGAAGSTPGEWAAGLASDDVRDAALALTLARTARERSRVALAVGTAPSLVAVLAIAFGLAPLVIAPVAAVVGTIAALAHARR